MFAPVDYALYYAGRGWLVFPITPGKKAPPMVKWAEEATCDADKIKAWWKKTPNANIGIMTGKLSHIMVLDIDAGHGGSESLMVLIAEHGQLPPTIEAMTGGGGRHMLFTYPPGVEVCNSAGKLGTGLDIRAEGGYIVAPPSLHPSGTNYEWEPSCLPSKTALAAPPPWLVELVAEAKQSPNGHKPARAVGTQITSGARNQTLTSLAGTMRRRGMGEDAIYAALSTENDKRCSPPLPDEDVRRISQSVGRYEPQDEPRITQAKPIEYREPLTSYEGVLKFIDLLDHLEGRSIQTYIPPIDDAIGGIERQTLTVLAARPSMGKSTLAWEIARNVARSGLKVLFFSLEMSVASLWAKAACGACGIRWKDVRAGQVPKAEIDRIIRKANELMMLYGEALLVDDGVNTTDTILVAAERHDPDLIIVDHLRLVADRMDDEVKRLGIVTQRFKDLAKAKNCGFLCLAQLNREIESHDNKRPQLSNLRDSGQIEENADLVLMMYREDYYNPSEKPMPFSVTELLVRKFRDDIANQQIKLYFAPKYQWFGDKDYAEQTQREGMQASWATQAQVV